MQQSRSFWLGSSWKMNGSKDMAEHYSAMLSRADWTAFPNIAPFVIPPFPYVERMANLLRASPVRVGVQNLHWAEEGAFTGEISARMAADIGASLAEIGHSERRAMFGETDETVRNKTRAALDAHLTPLICIGDTRQENDAGAAAATIIRQAKIALAGLAPEQVALCVLAYEPVWSIGVNGIPAEPTEVSATLKALREALVADHGEIGQTIPLLYGGSVSSDNVKELSVAPNIDGLFVGRAGWTADGLLSLVGAVAQARQR